MRVRSTVAKIAMPAPAGVVPRKRLFARMDTLGRKPLVWLGAAAGSGKTTLAASYLQARHRPCLWYKADARDADPATFFYYLREASLRLARRTRRALPLLTPEYALGADAYACHFFEELGERLPVGTWIVLDNYQDIPENAILHSLLPRAITSLPREVRVLVLSRLPPPAPFARLVAEGAVGLLVPEELDLTVAETRALARSRTTARIRSGSASALRARMGGWVAGTLLSLELRAQAPPSQADADAPEQRTLFDYFATEIFDRTAPDTRHLLLAIALLPEVDATSAEALSREPRAGEILADLVGRNYFTSRLMSARGARPRYRLHPLFREFLLERARRTYDAPTLRALAVRTARALVDGGTPDGAADILTAVGEWEGLVELIRAHAATLVGQGRHGLLGTWLRALPPATIEADPWLIYWVAVCSLAVQPQARASFERAYRMFQERGDLLGILASWAGFMSTYFYVWHEFRDLDPWIADMAEMCGKLTSFPSVEVEAQVTFAMIAGLMWRHTAHSQLPRWVERATALLESEAPPELRMQLANYLAFYWIWWKGENEAAFQLVERVQPLMSRREVTPLTEMLWFVMEAACRARVGDRKACFEAVDRGFETSRRTGIRGLNHLLAMQGVYGGLAAGDLEAARRYQALARSHLGSETLNAAHLNVLGAWLSLVTKDVPRAEHEVTAAAQLGERSGADLSRAWTDSALAHVRVEQGRHQEAVTLLSGSLDWSRRTGNPLMEHHCLLSLAWTHLARGSVTDALEWLRAGLRLGREHRYLTHPWIGWRRDVVARLAALALENEIEPEYVRDQIKATSLDPPDSALDLGSWPWPLRILTLGEFGMWRDASRISFAGKVPRKPIELLQVLIALGGNDVREESAADLLWPDSEGDAARRALEITIHRARRMVGSREILVQHERRLSFNPKVCWVDALVLRQLLRRGLQALEDGMPLSAETQRHSERILRLYQGPFLPALGADVPFAVQARDRLRADLRRYARALQSRPRADAWVARFVRRCADADSALA